MRVENHCALITMTVERLRNTMVLECPFMGLRRVWFKVRGHSANRHIITMRRIFLVNGRCTIDELNIGDNRG